VQLCAGSDTAAADDVDDADAVADGLVDGVAAADLPPPVPNRKYPPTASAATTHTAPVVIARTRTL
jgi:hypothetical protein